MRIYNSNFLLTGVVLATMTAAPALAQQDRIRQIVPMPPSLNGARVIHREATPLPPPHRAAARPVAPEPVAQLPEPAPQAKKRRLPCARRSPRPKQNRPPKRKMTTPNSLCAAR